MNRDSIGSSFPPCHVMTFPFHVGIVLAFHIFLGEACHVVNKKRCRITDIFTNGLNLEEINQKV